MESNKGTVGEGAGICVLERESDARAKDRKIYALITGTGSASIGPCGVPTNGGAELVAGCKAARARTQVGNAYRRCITDFVEFVAPAAMADSAAQLLEETEIQEVSHKADLRSLEILVEKDLSPTSKNAGQRS